MKSSSSETNGIETAHFLLQKIVKMRMTMTMIVMRPSRLHEVDKEDDYDINDYDDD